MSSLVLGHDRDGMLRKAGILLFFLSSVCHEIVLFACDLFVGVLFFSWCGAHVPVETVPFIDGFQKEYGVLLFLRSVSKGRFFSRLNIYTLKAVFHLACHAMSVNVQVLNRLKEEKYIVLQ